VYLGAVILAAHEPAPTKSSSSPLEPSRKPTAHSVEQSALHVTARRWILGDMYWYVPRLVAANSAPPHSPRGPLTCGNANA
jgi:hypothetical protein